MALSLQSRKKARGTRVTATVRKGDVTLSRTFADRRTAQRWGASVEDAIDVAAVGGKPFRREDFIEVRALPVVKLSDPDEAPVPRLDWTVRRALEHYRDTVTPSKSGRRAERNRVSAWLQHPMLAARMTELSTDEIQDHIDARLSAGTAAQTVRNDFYLLSALFRHAARPPRPGTTGRAGGGWGLAVTNPISAAHLPPQGPGRWRRLQECDGGLGEEDRVRAALLAMRGGEVAAAALTVGVETGLRMGEMLRLTVGSLRRERGARAAWLPTSKNGDFRKVTLSPAAAAALDFLVRDLGPDARPATRLVPLTEDALRGRWQRALRSAGVTDLRWHDLRHEALSRMASKGLHIGELQAQSGHRTPSILLRYINARPEDIARKLAAG